MSGLLRRAAHLKYVNRISLNLRRLSSTKAEVEQQKTELDLRTFNLSPRIVTKNPALPPLVKELFLGEIHEAFFPFLEVVQKEHVDKFFKDRQFTTNYFLDQSKEVGNLRQLGNFGMDVPQEFRGHGYAVTETTLNSEIEAENPQANYVLNQHRLVTQILIEHGTDQQKERYLTRLAEGDLIGTVAIFENQAAEENPFNTKATPTNAGFHLNGQKDFVVNAHKANLFLVLATSVANIHSHDQRVGVSAFLVDGNEPGINRGELLKTLGNESVEQSSVTFTDALVRTENVIGEVNNSHAIAMSILKHARLQSSVTAVQLSKKILGQFAKYCVETEILGGKLMDGEMLQVRLGRATSEIYAAESMIYFTTSLMDAYDKQDVDLEAAATKLFALESLIKIAEMPFHSVGPKCTTEEHSRNIRDAFQTFAQGETMDTMKIFIGLSGLQYSGEELADEVDRKRNPAMHPEGFFRRMFQGCPFDSIKITQNFVHFLHPALNPAAESLEIALKRFKIGVELSLTRHGRGILEAQTEVLRIARCVTLVYSCLATISRASRAYCIGLRYADMEILLANTYTQETLKEIKAITEDLAAGENNTNDMNHKNIAKQLFHSKGYFYEHPLVRVF